MDDLKALARELLGRHAPLDQGVVTTKSALRAIEAALSRPAGGDDYTTRTIADAAAALDKRGDRQMAARLMRLHEALAQPRTEQPAVVYSCPECGAGMEVDPTAKPAAEGRGEVVAWATHHEPPMLFPTRDEAASYCDDDECPIPLYAATPPRADAEVVERLARWMAEKIDHDEGMYRFYESDARAALAAAINQETK